jgi:hypothetical protein
MRDGRGAPDRESEPAAAQIAGLAGPEARHVHRVRAAAAVNTIMAASRAVVAHFCHMRFGGSKSRRFGNVVSDAKHPCMPGEERGAPMTAAPVA